MSYDTLKTRGQNWNGKIRLFLLSFVDVAVLKISACLFQALWPGTAAPMHIGPEPANSQLKPLDGRIILQLRHIWFGMI